jgi:FAD/FMN-containing dehydrogenase
MPKQSSPANFRGVFRADDDARAVYSEAAGIGRAVPLAVAVPADVDDLVGLVRWAAANQIPLIPRGSGSSMPGGAIGHGVIVDLSRWRDIGEVNATKSSVRAMPGALRADVDRAARAHGLRFPVDPSSGAFCTIGGMTSTNAAGAHSMRFGAMRPWVNAIECVFTDGAHAEIRRGAPPPRGIPAIDRFLAFAERLIDAEQLQPSRHVGVAKDSSGYGLASYAQSRELVDLIVGSEGTLVFVTAVERRLIPIASATSSVLGAFASLEDAVLGAQRARSAGAVACELLDRTFLDVAASGGAARQVPEETESALLAEVEGADAAEAERSARELERIFTESGATSVRVALEGHTETELWELRHAASPILARLDPALKSMQFVEDCAVPPERLPTYVRGVRKILERQETRGVIFGHAGDAHVHVNPLIDVSRPDWRDRVNAILEDVVTLAASLGGTLAGEHGDGRLRAPLLPRVWSAGVLARFAEVKRAFDPLGIMNPGAKIAIPGEHAIGEIKYDPAAPALPSRARAVLDRVERERAYSRSRLELLDEA